MYAKSKSAHVGGPKVKAMDMRKLEAFVSQLHEELRIIDRVIAGLEQIAADQPRRGRPRKPASSTQSRIPPNWDKLLSEPRKHRKRAAAPRRRPARQPSGGNL
jgi:hypothetical protein